MLLVLNLILYPYIVEDDLNIPDEANEIRETQRELPGTEEDQVNSIAFYIVE